MSEQYIYTLKIDTDTMVARSALALALYDRTRKKQWSFADVPGYAPIVTGLEIALLADELVVHSDYAVRTLERLYNVKFDRSRITDTLKLSEHFLGKGGNSIAAWAARLKIARDDYRGGPNWTPFVQKHAERDAQIISRVLDHLLATFAKDA